MWYSDKDTIQYRKWWDIFEISYLTPDWSLAPREIISVPHFSGSYLWYDDWVQQYPREYELQVVKNAINSLWDNPRKIHIAGLSCAESVDLIATYYREEWFQNMEAQNYTIPEDSLITISISLRHILWCEKDKNFLKNKDVSNNPYYSITPPLRLPSDLRSLQQTARNGVITCISLLPGDEMYFSQIFEREILTPFQLVQLVFYRWKRFSFVGQEQVFSLSFPDFFDAI